MKQTSLKKQYLPTDYFRFTFPLKYLIFNIKTAKLLSNFLKPYTVYSRFPKLNIIMCVTLSIQCKKVTCNYCKLLLKKKFHFDSGFTIKESNHHYLEIHINRTLFWKIFCVTWLDDCIYLLLLFYYFSVG